MDDAAAAEPAEHADVPGGNLSPWNCVFIAGDLTLNSTEREHIMDTAALAESVFKPSIDERREQTDAAYREIVNAETDSRRAKTERLRLARLQAQVH
jgi:hypothetical protein